MSKTTSVQNMLAAQRERAKVELCSCGHIRAAHDDTCGGLAIGHGACVANIRRGTQCHCEKFTWTPKTVKA